jgi:hypothetical protein
MEDMASGLNVRSGKMINGPTIKMLPFRVPRPRLRPYLLRRQRPSHLASPSQIRVCGVIRQLHYRTLAAVSV